MPSLFAAPVVRSVFLIAVALLCVPGAFAAPDAKVRLLLIHADTLQGGMARSVLNGCAGTRPNLVFDPIKAAPTDNDESQPDVILRLVHGRQEVASHIGLTAVCHFAEYASSYADTVARGSHADKVMGGAK
jgi:hypothetical protein